MKIKNIFALLLLSSCKSPSPTAYNQPERPLSFAAAAVAAPASKCAEGMLEVKGSHCPFVQQECLRWLDADQSPEANGGIGPMRCAEWKSPSVCLSPRRLEMDFCMSEFEYPNKNGTYPLVGMTYPEAKEMAAKAGNRLCTEEEFNFACEGEDMRPYGYGDGFHRDATVCNIDKPWVDYNNFKKSQWNDLDAGLYQGVMSDHNSKCKSWAGIVNINGNVDEILNSEHTENAALAGGYWGPVRNRCRPRTRSHSKTNYSFYQLGFHMCSNVK